MLQHLRISDFTLIDELEIDFSSGFNVFTGETGAGKTIILNALNLVLGERAIGDYRRPGADQLKIVAVFQPDQQTAAEVQKLFPLADEQLILQREINAKGKSLAKINAEIVPLDLLKRIGSLLVDIHGQHDHQSLLVVNKQRLFLDYFAGHEQLLSAVRTQWQTYHQLAKDLAAQQQHRAQAVEKLEYIKFQISEIEKVAPQAGEDEELQNERERLRHAEELYELAHQARDALQTADATLRQASLSKMAELDQSLAPLPEQQDTALAHLEDLSQELLNYCTTLTFEPQRLEEIEERLNNLHLLKRRFGGTLATVLANYEKLQKELELLDGHSVQLEELEKNTQHQYAQYLATAHQLSASRQQAASDFGLAIQSQLAELSLAKAHFKVNITASEPTSHGLDQVEFLIATNPGLPERPLAKIASGGELSRVMLALKTALAHTAGVDTMIFDEIDTGIGGQTALAVADKLEHLAETRQVLCITHLAQIAAKAHNHYSVQKKPEGTLTTVTVKLLSAQNREREIARMLSGHITDSTKQHAAELLNRE